MLKLVRYTRHFSRFFFQMLIFSQKSIFIKLVMFFFRYFYIDNEVFLFQIEKSALMLLVVVI